MAVFGQSIGVDAGNDGNCPWLRLAGWRKELKGLLDIDDAIRSVTASGFDQRAATRSVIVVSPTPTFLAARRRARLLFKDFHLPHFHGCFGADCVLRPLGLIGAAVCTVDGAGPEGCLVGGCESLVIRFRQRSKCADGVSTTEAPLHAVLFLASSICEARVGSHEVEV
jgi:hypothetical protein